MHNIITGNFCIHSTILLEDSFKTPNENCSTSYNELSQKTRFQSVPIAALCLYNIQRKNLVFKKSLGTCALRDRQIIVIEGVYIRNFFQEISCIKPKIYFDVCMFTMFYVYYVALLTCHATYSTVYIVIHKTE